MIPDITTLRAGVILLQIKGQYRNHRKSSTYKYVLFYNGRLKSATGFLIVLYFNQNLAKFNERLGVCQGFIK